MAVAIRRVLAPNPGPMTGPGTNSYLVGEREVALVDPGPESVAHADALLAAVPPGGRIKDIDPAVMRIVEEHWERLKDAWDAKYPENPISSVEDEEDRE